MTIQKILNLISSHPDQSSSWYQRKISKIISKDDVDIDSSGAAKMNRNKMDAGEFTPLAFASFTNNKEAVVALLELGADPNLPSQGFRQQWGPMQWAIYNKNLGMIQDFRDYGADMSDKAGTDIDNLYNWSPITTARHKYGDSPLLLKVISQGIDPMPSRNDSKTNYDKWSNYLPKLLCDNNNANMLERGTFHPNMQPHLNACNVIEYTIWDDKDIIDPFPIAPYSHQPLCMANDVFIPPYINEMPDSWHLAMPGRHTIGYDSGICSADNAYGYQSHSQQPNGGGAFSFGMFLCNLVKGTLPKILVCSALTATALLPLMGEEANKCLEDWCDS